MPSPRDIPSIEKLLQRPALTTAAAVHGRDRVAEAVRSVAARLREQLAREQDASSQPDVDVPAWIEDEAVAHLERDLAPSLRPVMNATGVIIHTNLGRAPLSASARYQATATAAGYANLEYDLDAGARGHRHVHAERLLRDLTGAEAALVVNNNAAATLVVLAALANGREVVVSRGELVEIGGGFRVPDVMAQSGALLREVGTTNRTRVADYGAAIGERTGLLLRVHPSNFRIEGFTERPSLADLAALAHTFDLPLFEDLGSGWLGVVDPPPPVLADEPSVRASLSAGVDLVAFSGDKLLGGPQSGIVVGRRDLVDRVRRHPLMRAVRADKLTYAALEATLALWAKEPSRSEIPVYRMLTMTAEEIERRAWSLAADIGTVPGLSCQIIDGFSTIGGGSAPESRLPTKLVAITVTDTTASALEERLRAGDPPVVARIEDDRVVLDLRTVASEEIDTLARAIAAIFS
jgi:L-seryl-tRNA(Ser) seleniumtransferase